MSKFVFQGAKDAQNPVQALKLGEELYAVGDEVELTAAELEFYSGTLSFEPADDKAAKSLDKVEEKAAKDAVAGLTEAEAQVLGVGEFADNSGTEEVK